MRRPAVMRSILFSISEVLSIVMGGLEKDDLIVTQPSIVLFEVFPSVLIIAHPLCRAVSSSHGMREYADR